MCLPFLWVVFVKSVITSLKASFQKTTGSVTVTFIHKEVLFYQDVMQYFYRCQSTEVEFYLQQVCLNNMLATFSWRLFLSPNYIH